MTITKCLLFLCSLCTSAVNASLSFVPKRYTTTYYPYETICFNLYTIRGGDEDTDGDKQDIKIINDDDVWDEEIRRTREFYRSLGKTQNVSNDEKIDVVVEDERSFGSNAYTSIQSEISGENLELSVLQEETNVSEVTTDITQNESIEENEEDQDVVLRETEDVTYDLVVGEDTSSDESTQEEDVDIEIEELIEEGLVRLHNKDGINPRLAITEAKEMKSLPSQFYKDIEHTKHHSRLRSIRRFAGDVASRHTMRRIAGFVVGCALSFVFSPSNHDDSKGMPTVATTPSKEVEEDLDDESEETPPILQPADLDKNLWDKLISLVTKPFVL